MNRIIRPTDGIPVGDWIDFSPVISKWIEETRDGEIRFEPGEYHFFPEHASLETLYVTNTDSLEYPQKRIGIRIADLDPEQKLVLRGNNTTLIFHGAIMAFAFLRSGNILLENLTIDYACPSVIDLVVDQWCEDENTAIVSFPNVYRSRVEKNHVIWESEKSPYTGLPYFTGRDGLGLSQHRRANGKVTRTKKDLFWQCAEIQQLSDSRLLLRYNEARDISQGDVFQMRDTRRDACGFFMEASRNITFSNLRICYSYGMGMIAQCCENLSFSYVRWQTAAPDRFSASAADMLHFCNCRGNIHIHDSIFSNPHDDPINVHGVFLIVEKVKGNIVTLVYRHPQALGYASFFAGDEIAFYPCETLVAIGTARVIEAIGPTSDDLTHITLTLDVPPPLFEGLGEIAVENRSRMADVTIENNTFVSVPTRGILASTGGKIRILHNRFENIHMACIYFSCDAKDWYESGPVCDAFVEGNTFENCDAEGVLIESTNTIQSDETVHKNIRIAQNKIIDLKQSEML